ncbi:MAG: PAS domain S-box protein, partial [Acidobacteria bacterium]|nr:PAS domain S-box protein [Acidobacteriota bacterium]
KQIEEALSLTQFSTDRAAFDVVWLGPDAQFLYVNDGACRSSGYSREELLSMTIHDIQADPRSPEMWPAHWAELKERGSFSFETHHRRKNGEIYPVEVTVNYIEFGGKAYNCGFFQDITERKRLEQQIQGSLERRTRQVQTSVEIAQEVANVPALDDLFHRVVNLVQERFGYYHVQLYMFQEGDLILQEGSGEAGRQMKETGYKIPLSAEQSLAVRAVWTGGPVLAPDVSKEPSWLPNPLLPETKSEITLPIQLGVEVMGVLAVQSETVGGLSEDDQLLLLGLCGQIAVAIESTRRLEETQAALAAAQQSQELLRTVVDATPDWIFVKDREHRFRMVNQAFAQALHFTPEDFIGKNDLEMGFPEDIVKGNPEKGIRGFWEDDRRVMDNNEP